MQKSIALIDLNKLKNNALFARQRAGKRKLFAVVKADAYGHGATTVALSIENVVDGFCVAITGEGAALRIAGVTKPILVFTPPLGYDDLSRAKLYDLQVTVNSVQTALAADNLKCHVKVNTGMNRLGCQLSELPKILRYIKKDSLIGIYSHLFAPENAAQSSRQLALFKRATEIAKSYNPDVIAHLSASGGLLRGGEYLFDGARCGILLYGYPPAGFSAPVSPIMRVYARKVQSTPFIGGGVGYARAQREYTRLTTYRLGYADGFARTLPLGESNLCMDSFISTSDSDLFPVLTNAADYASRANTISYEVLCAATRRAERIYEE